MIPARVLGFLFSAPSASDLSVLCVKSPPLFASCYLIAAICYPLTNSNPSTNQTCVIIIP